MSESNVTLFVGRVKEFLSYDQNTGRFNWRTSRRRSKAGDIAGSMNAYGYVRIKIDGKAYFAHRLAWLFVYGEEPKGLIDHIDCDKTNNRISNLRVCNHSENKFNRPAPRTNTSGVKGVSWSKRWGKWMAYISINNKSKKIGGFDSIEAAAEAYQKFAKELHGEFYHP